MSIDAERRAQALSFGQAADLYDSIRPSYPADAVAWALAPLGPGTWRIADIGAGTGLMTRVLLAAGHEVIAVEPDIHMRRRLSCSTVTAVAVPGSAESLPLPDAGVDGAVAAQAYHWFDRDRAHAELARAIRPGGVFAAIWNDRDESVPWTAEYSRIVAGKRHHDRSGAQHRAVTSFGPGFGEIEQARFQHTTTQTPDGLLRLMRSRSYYLTASEQHQRELDEEVRELTRTDPDLAGRGEFELPYVTLVFRALRLGS